MSTDDIIIPKQRESTCETFCALQENTSISETEQQVWEMMRRGCFFSFSEE